MFPVRRFRSIVTLSSAACLVAATGLAAAGAGCSSPEASHVSLGVLGSFGSPDTATTAAADATRIADVTTGATVVLEGTVLRHLDDGLLRLADDSGSIRVLVPGLPRVPAAEGERLRVEGVVRDDAPFGLARPEVTATAIVLASGVRLEMPAAPAERTPAATPAATDDRITPIGSLRRGQPATVRGTVARILDSDELRLTDDTGSVRVYVGWRNRVPARAGERVTVSGVMDDDPWPLRPELYADTITLADGTRVDLRTGSRTPAGDGAGGGSGSPSAAPPAETAPSPLAVAPSLAAALADGSVRVTPVGATEVGRLVAVRGTVERLIDTDEFRLADDSGSIGVYVGWRNRVPAAVGDVVTVLGAVDAEGPGGTRRELYAVQLMQADGAVVDLQRPAPVRVARDVPIGGGAAAPAPAPTGGEMATATALGGPVTAVADVRRGQSVVLVGTVDRLPDSDEFVLRDETGTIEVSIGWRNRMPVRVGDRVVVAGTADDDVFPGRRPDVYADRIQLPDGSVVRLRRDD